MNRPKHPLNFVLVLRNWSSVSSNSSVKSVLFVRRIWLEIGHAGSRIYFARNLASVGHLQGAEVNLAGLLHCRGSGRKA
jgi:hypothetical protein